MRYPSIAIGTSALVASRVVSTGPCKLVGVTGFSDGTAAYLMIFELAAVPANGTAAKYTIVMDAGRNFAFQLPDAVDLDACCIAPSSSVDTLTLVAGNHQSIQAVLAG